MISTVLPYYDKTNGTVSVLGLSSDEVQSEDNSITEKQTGWLYTYTLEGEVLDTEEILLPEDIGYIAGGVITDNTLLFMQSTVYATVLYSVDRETDETRQTEEGKAFFGNNNFTCAFVTTDMDGQIYCTDRNTLYVLAPDLSLIYSLKFPTSIYTMARGADGEIWVTFNAGMESCAAKIANEVRTLGAYYSFPGEPDSLVKKQHHLLDAAIIEEAYNFYYYDADILYGMTITENGSMVEEPVVNLYNSGNVICQPAPTGNLQYSIGSLELGLRNTFDPKKILDFLLHDAVEYYGADRAYICEADWHLGIFTNMLLSHLYIQKT